MTEITVSIPDQLLIVSPTVRPKYCLTSQNPASFTCEKNTDPAPMASTSSASSDGDSPLATPETMPAAVMVATVADPVASRIPTATSQPSTSGDTLDPFAQA